MSQLSKHKINNLNELMCLGDKAWRLSHLYYLKDPHGKRMRFKPNWAQQILLGDSHPCKIVLKARQLGITTVCAISALDDILFSTNLSAGVIAHTLDDAQNIFADKLKFAFDNLDPRLRALYKIVGDNAKELSLSNGSIIRVGTSLRSSTLQRLHISEFGKICAKHPEKAREIITGSLNTVHSGQHIIIESTAEGREGRFFQLWQQSWAQQKSGEPFGPLDFKPFFFPWWKEPTYILHDEQKHPSRLADYYDKLFIDGIILNDLQKNWYTAKFSSQGEDMLREYPSTPEEAFAVSQEGYWYAQQMKDLYQAGRCTKISHDPSQPVHTAWDLGQADAMAIWFFQINSAGELMIIDYFEQVDFTLHEVAQMLQQKGFVYGTHIWPHDANTRDRAGSNFVQQARDLRLSGMVLEASSIQDGINLVRATLPRMWFNEDSCRLGLSRLETYAKRWNSTIGGYTGEPLHNLSSHGADAMRYLCQGLKFILRGQGSLKGDYEAVNNYFRF